MQKQVNRKALTLNIHMRLASIIKLIEAEPHLSQREIDQKMGVIPQYYLHMQHWQRQRA
jgi:hypothetical protein